MKMILGILNNDDAPVVIQHLNKAGFFVTRLSTSGGFLRAGIVTILVGIGAAKLIAAPIGAAATAVGNFVKWATVLQPLWMGTMPVMERSVVDLPAPFAPIRVTISPSFTSKEMPLMAWMLP